MIGCQGHIFSLLIFDKNIHNDIILPYKEPLQLQKSKVIVVCVMKYFLCVLGMVMFIEGFPYVAFPHKLKVWLVRIAEFPTHTLRIYGFLLMATGLVVIYWAQR